MKTKVERITPKKAQQYLDGHDNFRLLKRTTINKYADCLERGVWELNGEAIKFNSEGRLVDGQHRLHAVIQSGIPMETLVVYGVDKTEELDNGKARQVSDYLRAEGISSCTVAASAISYYLEVHDTKTLMKSKRPARDRIIAEAKVNQHMDEIIKIVWNSDRIAPMGPVCGMMLLFADVDAQEALAFAASYSSGADLEEGNPILALRKRLIRVAQYRKNSQIKDGARKRWHIPAYIIKAWNALRTGRQIHTGGIAVSTKFPLVHGLEYRCDSE